MFCVIFSRDAVISLRKNMSVLSLSQCAWLARYGESASRSPFYLRHYCVGKDKEIKLESPFFYSFYWISSSFSWRNKVGTKHLNKISQMSCDTVVGCKLTVSDLYSCSGAAVSQATWSPLAPPGWVFPWSPSRPGGIFIPRHLPTVSYKEC